MNIRLTNIRKLGRYTNKATGQQVNVHKGQRRCGGVGDVFFFIRSGARVLIPEAELFRDWKRVDENAPKEKPMMNRAEKISAVNNSIPKTMSFGPRGRGYAFNGFGSYILLREFTQEQIENLTVAQLVNFAQVAEAQLYEKSQGEEVEEKPSARLPSKKEKAEREMVDRLNRELLPLGVRITTMGRGWAFHHEGLYRGLSRFLSKPLIETPDLDLVEFAKLAKESILQQIANDAGPQYSVATTTVGQNWNDSGMRHRVECSDGRVSGWARYEQMAYLDNVASLTPYFVGGEDVVTRSISEALTFIAVGPNDNGGCEAESEIEEAGE